IEPALIGEDGSPLGVARVRLWDDNDVRPNSLTVFETPETEVVWVVREATWEQTKDEHRLMDLFRDPEPRPAFVPTITLRDAWVPRKDITAFVTQASALSLPLASSSGAEAIGPDITTRGLEFLTADGSPARFRLEWSDVAPADWQPILDWVARLHTLLGT